MTSIQGMKMAELLKQLLHAHSYLNKIVDRGANLYINEITASIK